MHQIVRMIASSNHIYNNGHIYIYFALSPAVLFGESIASEGIGEHMFVEGRVLTADGKPIPGAVIDTWETDGEGEPTALFRCVRVFTPDDGSSCAPQNPSGVYDMEYTERTAPECRGRLRTDGEGKYGYRAIVPVSYAIPDNVGAKLALSRFIILRLV